MIRATSALRPTRHGQSVVAPLNTIPPRSLVYVPIVAAACGLPRTQPSPSSAIPRMEKFSGVPWSPVTTARPSFRVNVAPSAS